MEKKLDKLAGRKGRRRNADGVVVPHVPFDGSRLKLFGLTGLLAAGLALGLGILVANAESSYEGVNSDHAVVLRSSRAERRV